jgi:hypothetical protein
MFMRLRFLLVLFTLALTLSALTVGSAFAAKPSGGGKGGGGTSSLSLVLVNSTNGVPHWGQQITFNVSTTVTTEPHVSVVCTQNGSVVYGAETGYYASYPWPWTQIMTLSSQSWTGGAASCTATLYYFSGTNTVNLTSLSFQVYA